MTLTSVYKQMFEKGYDWAMECKYLGKTFEVYTNCSVESSDATTEEKITLEQILKNLVFSKDGKCSIREIYLLFENYNIDVSSFREVYFKLV